MGQKRPPDLIPAIKHLRKSFEEAHWGCGWTTQLFCYSLLHNETVDDPTKEYFDYLMFMKARVGPAATQRFHDLIRQSTPPSIFKAFYDLYLEGVSVHALIVFNELTEIGRANERRLGVPQIEWAQAQTKHLIRSERHVVWLWVREVCDKHPYNPEEDLEERVFSRKWEAPNLLAMKPSRFQPYDATRVWDRNDAETSARWLDAFADDYVLHLEIKLEKKAGEAALELAKRPQLAQNGIANTGLGEEIVATGTATENNVTPNNVRREARKLNTQEMYKSWQREYHALKKRRPEASDVWYSQQIAKMPIAKGSSPETIRKRMKK